MSPGSIFVETKTPFFAVAADWSIMKSISSDTTMDFRRYIFRGLSEDKEELIRKNQRLIILRWIYLGILGAIAVGAPYLVDASTVTVFQHAAIFGTGLILNTVLYFANKVKAKSITYYSVISFLQILIDLGVATAGVAIQGGVYARTIILYVLPILAAGLLFMSKPLVYSTALLSAIAYDTTIVGAMMLGDAKEILPHVGGPFLFYPVLFFIIARLVIYLNEHNMKNTQSETQEELLAMLTHQLRHPGSVIRAIIDTMEQSPEIKDCPELAHYLSMIKTENAGNIHLVNNVLQAAAPVKEEEKKEIEIVGLIKQIARNNATASNRAGDLKVRGIEEAKVKANMDQLHLVLENLLTNALRYSEPGTPIDVDIEESKNRITVSVTDHGAGMNKQQLETVFDKFGATTTPEGKPAGAGLGMHLVKKLVEAEGGDVYVESLPGEGTTVTIIFKRS